jgi:hypothetical protein
MQVESTGKTEYVTTFDDEGRSTSRGGGGSRGFVGA